MGVSAGPNVVRDSDYQVHLCTSSGTFLPNFTGNIEVLVVAGGGGGGMDMGGGGGGGGVLTSTTYAVTAGTPITVTVGAGGVGAPSGGPPQPWGHQFTTSATSGSNSSIGVNLIQDGTFSSGITGWGTYNSSISWYNNSLRSISSSGNPAGATYYFNTVIGQTYYYKADVTQSGAISNDARIQISGIGLINSTGQSTVTDTKTIYDTFTATSTTHILEILLYNSQPGALLTIDNVEVYPTNSSLVAIGGGYGGSSYFGYTPNYGYGANGGSGGGASGYSDGNTGRNGSGTVGQGNDGGSSVGQYYSGGGGGAGAAGSNGGLPHGGAGVLNNILGGGRNLYWAGGGGGASYSSGTGGNGGLGGGGGGASNGNGDTNGLNPARNAGGGGGGQWVNTPGGDAGKNTGGGGGGGMHYNRNNRGGNGGSGVVIIRHLKSSGSSTFNGMADNRSSMIFCMDPANVGKGLAVEVLAVGGGGGGGMDMGGGGGGGGVVERQNLQVQINSPMAVIVGAGGNGSPGPYGGNPPTGSTGTNSSMGDIVAYGGGGGGSGHVSYAPYTTYGNGSAGNGGGAGGDSAFGGAGKGMGTDPAPLDVPQGYSGGSAKPYSYGAGGGGGANRPGGAGRYLTERSGNGGDGILSSINGSNYYWGGGGGGAGWQEGPGGNGGLGGGGGGSVNTGYTAGSGDTNGINAGGNGTAATSSNGGNGGANTGGGGGGGTHAYSVGGNGGSGIVIVRYYGSQQATGGTITSAGGYTIHTFTSSGTFTPTGVTGVRNLGINDIPLTTYSVSYSNDNGGCYTWDAGVDARIQSGVSSFAFGTGDFTLECWINPTNFSGYTHMIALPDQNTFALKGNTGDGAIYFYSSSFTTYPTSGWTLVAGTWNHVVMTRASGVSYSYLNGVLKGSKAGFDNNFTAQTLNIGNGHPNEYTAKKIACVKIYNKALTAEEILQNFAALRGRFGI